MWPNLNQVRISPSPFHWKEQKTLLPSLLQIAPDRHQPVARQNLSGPANHFDRQMTARMKSRRRGGLGPRAVGKEMIERLVGIGEGITVRQALDQLKHFSD